MAGYKPHVPFPRWEAMVAVSCLWPTPLCLLGMAPAQPGDRSHAPSMSAPSLIIRAAGTRLVRRGAKRLGPVGPGRWMAGQQAPRPSPMQEAMGNHPAGHAPPMGKGPIKKPAVYILNKKFPFSLPLDSVSRVFAYGQQMVGPHWSSGYTTTWTKSA